MKNMYKTNPNICIIFAFMILPVFISAGENLPLSPSCEFVLLASFHDIPGTAEGEVTAAGAFRGQNASGNTALEATNPLYIIIMTVLLLLVIVFAALFIARSKRAKDELERLVHDRTRELEKQTSLLMAIFDSSVDFIFCKNLESRYTHCNKSTIYFFNVNAEDVIGKTDAEAFGLPPQTVEKFLHDDKKVIEEKRTFVFEEKIKSHLGDGKEVLVETMKAPIIQNGKVTGILGIARDITKRKALEDEFKQQASTLTTLIDTIPDLCYATDLNLKFSHFNKALMKHFGLKKSGIIGKDVFSTRLPEELAEQHQIYNRRVIHGGETILLEERLPHVNGSCPLYETIRLPIVVEGVVTGALGIGRDITKRKEIELEFEMQTAMLTALLDSIPDFIFAKDLNFRFIQCNKSFLDHFGLRREDVIGRIDTDVITWAAEEVEKIREGDKQVITERRTITREQHPPQSSGGALIVTETVKTPLILNGAVVGVLGIARDITKSKALEEAALTASHSKSAFLASMSHEIRTPMNSIIGFSELAMDSEIPPKVKNYLTNILKNSEWLLQIINDILDLSKIESGRMELENVPFDLQELFADCREIIIPKAVEKNITLHFYTEPNIGRGLLGDPTRLRQVLLNLLSNAVKFTNSGFVKVSADIKERGEKNIVMYFEVKDSGIGMTTGQLERIFVPFMQAETGTTRKYGGTGLGLPITKKIIELMKGKLLVESVVGVGSTFSFELTFDTTEVSDDEMQKGRFVFRNFEKPVFEGEILVCEDNIMNQQVICEHLARVGLKTVIAENGRVGVDMVKSRKENNEKQFKLIFMDIHMPVMDGIEAAVEILGLKTGIPIVAMTANIMHDDIEFYRTSGMDECIGKPFSAQELWRCLLKYFTPVSWQVVKENRQTQLESELRQKLIHNFVKDNKNRFCEIKNALDIGDIKLAYRLVHTLKSNAGHLNKTRLQFAAANFEQQLKDGKNTVSLQQMQILETELEAALSQFDAELEANPAAPLVQSAAHAEPLDAAAVQELILKLEKLLELGNPECLNFVDKLRRIPLKNSTSPGSLIWELIQHIENFDFEQASIGLAKLKAEWIHKKETGQNTDFETESY